MRKLLLHRLDPTNERGATIFVVLVSLIAIFGLTALAVDGGGMLVLRKRLVTTADSAALSGALAFADAQKSLAICGTNDQPAIDWSNQDATSNGDANFAPTPFSWLRHCPGAADTPPAPCPASLLTTVGCVSVTYEGQTNLYFAPVLGFQSNKLIHATAAAEWGPAGSGSPPPLMIQNVQMIQCGVIDANGNLSTTWPKTCAIWIDNQNSGSNSVWAWLDLGVGGSHPGWDVPKDALCNGVPASSIDSWIQTPIQPVLSLEYPNPTYVCAGNGRLGNPSASATDLTSLVGQTRWFPINCETQTASGTACQPSHGQVDSGGNLCPPPPNGGCNLDKFDIIGFAPMKVQSALVGTCSGGGLCNGHPLTNCEIAFPSLNKNQTINVLTYAGSGSGGTNCPGPAGATGAVIRGLPGYSTGTCASLTVYVCQKSGPNVIPMSGPCGTCQFNFASPNFTWLDNNTNKTTYFDFQWDTPSSGPCSAPGRVENANALCMVLQWNGPQVGGGNPGQGFNFGLNGVRLVG